MIGAAFIYTNQETVSIGVGVSTEDIVEGKENVNDLLEKFKYHPCIEPYVRGGESLEYSAHLIPEGGYNRLPTLVRDGLILVGDAAGFVNATHYHEGTNLAMASGKLAGEAVIKAKKTGEFSEQGLRSYVESLNNSFVMKDLKKFRHFYDFMRKNKEILRDYPAIYSELLSDYFTISQEPKEEIQKKVLRKFRNKIGYFKTLRLLYQIRKALF
jgi:electron transfer flavoprotein-quinone oxidoreductase